MDYLLHVLIFTGIYVILAVSLDLLAGHTGILSIAHAAFYGLGAYTSALLSVRLGAPFLVGILIGMVVAALISFIVSLPSLRLHTDYFVIATLGFQMILYSIFNNWVEVTEGPLGIPGVPEPRILGFSIRSNLGFLALTAIASAFSYLIVYRISSSPFGRVLRAIREDEVFAQALGKNTVRFKVTTFAVSAGLAALAGSLYAHYVTFVDPTNFTLIESILVISMVIIGGAGSLWGPLIGATALVFIPEMLRFAGLPSSVAANFRQIFYGTLLVAMMVVRPRGLLGRYGFGSRYRE